MLHSTETRALLTDQPAARAGWARPGAGKGSSCLTLVLGSPGGGRRGPGETEVWRTEELGPPRVAVWAGERGPRATGELDAGFCPLGQMG